MKTWCTKHAVKVPVFSHRGTLSQSYPDSVSIRLYDKMNVQQPPIDTDSYYYRYTFDVKTNTITVLVVVIVAAVVLIVLDLIFGGAIHLVVGA